MKHNGKPPRASTLEAELTKLAALVRERRKQLRRLAKCPNKDCPCRFIWREHVETNLANQVVKIQRQVRRQTPKPARPQKRSVRRSR